MPPTPSQNAHPRPQERKFKTQTDTGCTRAYLRKQCKQLVVKCRLRLIQLSQQVCCSRFLSSTQQRYIILLRSKVDSKTHFWVSFDSDRILVILQHVLAIRIKTIKTIAKVRQQTSKFWFQISITLLEPKLPKNWFSHIDASLSRQPLVKGERLVRYEVNAVIPLKKQCHTESNCLILARSAIPIKTATRNSFRNNCHRQFWTPQAVGCLFHLSKRPTGSGVFVPLDQPPHWWQWGLCVCSTWSNTHWKWGVCSTWSKTPTGSGLFVPFHQHPIGNGVWSNPYEAFCPFVGQNGLWGWQDTMSIHSLIINSETLE